MKGNAPPPSLDLIRRSIAGDQGAFEKIFNDYKNLVYKTAFLMLESNQDSEDILQTVFLQVYKSLDKYDPSKGAFTTWLYRITINQCINFRRRKRFSILSITRQIENSLFTQSSHEKQVADEQALDSALSTLSDKLRAVVFLRYYWEMSYAEIATSLEIPLGTVRSRLSLALTKLNSVLETTAEDIYKETAK